MHSTPLLPRPSPHPPACPQLGSRPYVRNEDRGKPATRLSTSAARSPLLGSPGRRKISSATTGAKAARAAASSPSLSAAHRSRPTWTRVAASSPPGASAPGSDGLRLFFIVQMRSFRRSQPSSPRPRLLIGVDKTRPAHVNVLLLLRASARTSRLFKHYSWHVARLMLAGPSTQVFWRCRLP